MLDDVHRRHRQTGAVDQAGDVAVQADVVQVELGGGDLAGIFLALVAHRDDVRMAEQRVVVEAELRVQRQHPAVRGGDQRVDLDHRAIERDEELVEIGKQLAELLGDVAGQAERRGQLADFVGLQAEQRVDELADDLFRGVVGDVLDAHAAFGRRHDHRTAGRAVHQDREVVLVGDVDRFGDHHLADELAFLAGLHRDEGFVEHLAGELRGLLGRFDQVDPALEAVLEVTLAAATRVDLGLDHQLGAGEFLRGGGSFFRGGRNLAHRARDLESVKEFFRLVFVDVHGRRKIAATLRFYARPVKEKAGAKGKLVRNGDETRSYRSSPRHEMAVSPRHDDRISPQGPLNLLAASGSAALRRAGREINPPASSRPARNRRFPRRSCRRTREPCRPIQGRWRNGRHRGWRWSGT